MTRVKTKLGRDCGARTKKKMVGIVGTRSLGLWVGISLAFHAIAMTTWRMPVTESISDVATPSFIVTFTPLPVGPIGTLAPVAKHETTTPSEASATVPPEKLAQSVPAAAATESRGVPVSVKSSASATTGAPSEPLMELQNALDEFDRDQAEVSAELAALTNGRTVISPSTPNADQVRTRLTADLQKFFDHYPAIAQTHGWQGQVVLAVTVETDGRLTGIHILRSSGNAVLDRHALESLEKVQKLQITSGWKLPASLPLELPVTYVLANLRTG